MDETKFVDAEFDQAAIVAFEVDGVFNVGLSASSDRPRIIEDCLPVNVSFAVMMTCLHVTTASLKGNFDSVRNAIIAAGLWIVQAGAHGPDSYTTDAAYPSIKEGDIADAKNIKLSKSDASNGLLLLFATKATFWQTNHHVGQGSFTGYIRKVVKSVFGDDAVKSNEVFNCVWKLGHWADTAKVWAIAGISNLTQVAPKKGKITVAIDAQMRFDSFPAGTAKVSVCAAVVRKIMSSLFFYVLPPIPGLSSLLNEYASISADRAKYHIGAAHFHKTGKKASCEVSEDLLTYCSAFIHAAYPGTTMSRSPSLLPIEDVRAHVVYGTITSINLALARKGMNNDDKLKVMAALGGGAASAAESIDRDGLLLLGYDEAVANTMIGDITKHVSVIKNLMPPADDEKTGN